MINNYSKEILINFIALRKRLKQEYRYSEMDVLHTVWRLINAADEIKVAFAKWFNDDVDPNLECEGVTWEALVSKRGLNPFNAFLFMDSMKRDPAQGMNLLKGQMRPSLRLRIDELRPELREQVELQKEKEGEKMEVHPDKDGNIDLK